MKIKGLNQRKPCWVFGKNRQLKLTKDISRFVARTPALAIYFEDPDGQELEFIAILEGESRPELGIISYEEWMKRSDLNK